MKLVMAALALTGTILGGGAALADHPVAPSPSIWETDRNEFQHVQRGWFMGNQAAGASADARARASGQWPQ